MMTLSRYIWYRKCPISWQVSGNQWLSEPVCFPGLWHHIVLINHIDFKTHSQKCQLLELVNSRLIRTRGSKINDRNLSSTIHGNVLYIDRCMKGEHCKHFQEESRYWLMKFLFFYKLAILCFECDSLKFKIRGLQLWDVSWSGGHESVSIYITSQIRIPRVMNWAMYIKWEPCLCKLEVYLVVWWLFFWLHV